MRRQAYPKSTALHACSINSLNVHSCLTLAYAIRDNHLPSLRWVFSALEQTQSEVFPGLPLTIPTLREGYRQIPIKVLQKETKDLRAKAQALLALRLEPNLSGVDRVYDAETGKSVFRFRSLIQLIYWQIADGINGDRLRQCRECQAYFFADHDSREFCPPPRVDDEALNRKKESRCAKRHNQRGRRMKKAKALRRKGVRSA